MKARPNPDEIGMAPKGKCKDVVCMAYPTESGVEDLLLHYADMRA